MAKSRRITGPAAAGVATVCSAAALAAAMTTQDGAFTSAQAERGRMVYEEFCVACHETDFYRTTLPVWQNAYVGELFDALSATMPAENPGALTTAQYLDVLTYVFSITGSPAGEAELTLENMGSIEIVVTD